MSWKRKLEKSWGRLGMKYKLSDICDIKIGRTPPRKESQWFNTGLYSDYTWVSIKDLGECNKYIDFSSETISLDGQEKFNIPIVKTGTILLSFKLTVGRVAIATKNLLTNEAIAQLPIKDSSKVDRDFLYYYLLRYPWSTLGSTSSIATAINSKLIKEMEVELPDILMQRKIANILSTFDEKINTNYDTNNNLLEQASTLFNSAIQQSTSVVYAELGSLAEVKGGKRLPKGINLVTTPNQHPYIRVRDLNNTVFASLSNDYEYVDDETQQSISRYIVSTGDLLISIVGTIGLTAIVDHTLNKANLTENCVKLTNIKNVTPEYLLLFLRSSQGVEAISKGTVGAVQLKLPIKNIQSIAVPLLCDEELQSLNEKLSTIFSQISANIVEMKQLADIRDTLLPKLMSGELDVSNIDL